MTVAVLQPLFPSAQGLGASLMNLISDSPEKKAQALLETLMTAKVLDPEGRVTDAEALTPERIGAALPPKLRDKTPALVRLLRSLTPTHVQMGPSSDLANVAAWRAYLGESPEVLQSLQIDMMDRLAEQGEDPRAFSQAAWAALPAQIAQLHERSRAAPTPTASSSTPSSSEVKTPAPTDSKTTTTASPSSAAPARQPPATRYGLIGRARADLNGLRDAWQGVDAKQRTAKPRSG